MRERADVRDLHGDARAEEVDGARPLVRTVQDVGGHGGRRRDGGRQEACAAEQHVEEGRLAAAEPAAKRDDGLADQRAKEQEVIELVVDIAEVEVERREIGRRVLLQGFGQTLLDCALKLLELCRQGALIARRLDDFLEDGDLVGWGSCGHGGAPLWVVVGDEALDDMFDACAIMEGVVGLR